MDVVGSANIVVEPVTSVNFQQSLSLPGCSNSMVLLGTGYREKIFTIIGVKVYAVGLYASQAIIELLNTWKGRSASEIQEDPSLFSSFFQDGKTFWDALDGAVSPRIKAPTPVDESALSLFRNTFQGRALKKGTLIFLTWPNPSKMLVCISLDGLPSSVDASIESKNVSSALFDVFLGDAPVSPSLKASVSNGLSMILN
ncbi:hypothetical protein GIB67_022278 [Kingdonia uniflora]|uniref:Chalcone isomerase domain-containing protein n=1 Tax=Kingdonia uniflora TaxID=39325 RepID=A0A7J7KW27_9MAGN|nr:hypothetical protein GIB67_022278 [Kingdonia uniflora]